MNNSSSLFQCDNRNTIIMKLLLHLIIMGCYTTSQIATGAKILCILPYPSYSHQKALVNVCKTLSLRGHQVTVITPNPLGDKKLINLTEIDISFLYDLIRERNFHEIFSSDRYLITTIFEKDKLHISFSDAILTSKRVKELLENKDEYFHIVLVEAHNRVMFAFGEKYKVPIVGK